MLAEHRAYGLVGIKGDGCGCALFPIGLDEAEMVFYYLTVVTCPCPITVLRTKPCIPKLCVRKTR